MVCIDSDVIIDFLRKKKEAVSKIMELEKQEELTTTSINMFELLIGFSELNKLEESYKFLRNMTLLDFGFEASEKAAEIFKNLKNKGELIDILDLMIASIAITNNQKLLTRNTRHFARISELKLEEA